MLLLEIPGREKLEIEHIVFDYNGTLAIDGRISDETRKNLRALQDLAEIHVLTADTHGTVRDNCAGLNINIETFPTDNAGSAKEQIVENLGKIKTICIGNGYNDLKMAEKAALFICILGEEGCHGKLMAVADVVVPSITAAFNLLFKPKRLIATLRN